MATRKPSSNAQFSAFLSRFSPEIVALVKRCLPKIRRAIPSSYQLVYEYSNSLVVAFGMSERGYEAIVAIAIFPRWIRLYFDKSVPDPKGLLKGSGTKVRSVTIKAHQTSITRISRHYSRQQSSAPGLPFRRPARRAWSSSRRRRSRDRGNPGTPNSALHRTERVIGALRHRRAHLSLLHCAIALDGQFVIERAMAVGRQMIALNE